MNAWMIALWCVVGVVGQLICTWLAAAWIWAYGLDSPGKKRADLAFAITFGFTWWPFLLFVIPGWWAYRLSPAFWGRVGRGIWAGLVLLRYVAVPFIVFWRYGLSRIPWPRVGGGLGRRVLFPVGRRIERTFLWTDARAQAKASTKASPKVPA